MSDGSETTKVVEIEGRTEPFRLEALSTRRSGQITDAIGALFEAYGKVFEDREKKRRELATELTYTREMCSERAAVLRSRAATASEAESAELELAATRWERLLDQMGDRESVTIVSDPPEEQVWVAILRPAIQRYGDEIARLVGLLVMTNEQYGVARKAARRGDGPAIDEVLLDKGDEVLDELRIDGAIKLLIAGAELVHEDVEASRELAGKLQEVAKKMVGWATEDDSQSLEQGSETKSDTSSESSTDSPDDTAGQKTTSSTASPAAEPSISAT